MRDNGSLGRLCRRAAIILTILIGVSVTALLGLRTYRSKELLMDMPVLTARGEVQVVSNHLRHLQFFRLPHFGPLISFGDEQVVTEITFPGGFVSSINSAYKPRSLWESGLNIYIICTNNGRWEFYKIDKAYRISKIHHDDLPEGLPSWNLLTDGEAAKEWDARYVNSFFFKQ